MFKSNLFRSPVFISTLLAIIIIAALVSCYYIWFPDRNIWYLAGSIIGVVSTYFLFHLVLWIKRHRQKKSQQVETEEETLSMVLRPLLQRAGKKSIYLVLGNKGAGKEQFLLTSNAVKPMDKINTVKNDFFHWMESENVVYIKPDRRLIFQEISNVDGELWHTLVQEIIRHRPRKPFNGCLFFIDFEFFIVNEEEQVDYTLTSLLSRLKYIGEEVSAALPVYLLMSKLDKLEGFKEYVQFSPLKTTIEYLSIPMKEAKGASLDYFNDSYNNLIRILEANALDSSAKTNNTDEKTAILAFSKQFELCRNEIAHIVDRLNSLNHGDYSLDIREIFFTSVLQSGRKYNLLAKSCSNYFNLPVIASQHSHLSETPYFTRFLVQSQILPEADFAGENKKHLRHIQRNSRLTVVACLLGLIGSAAIFSQTVKNNIAVMEQLLHVENNENIAQVNDVKSFNTQLAKANRSIRSSYDAWLKGNNALDEEISSFKLSRLEETTKLAYNMLFKNITKNLTPLIEQGYRIELSRVENDTSKSLPLLKGYLMLKDSSKRDMDFLRKETEKTLSDLSQDSALTSQTMDYLDAFFRTQFKPIDINMDLVRATRRELLAKPKVDLVYSQLLKQADEIGLGQFNLERAVGFSFSSIFNESLDDKRLTINKVYTSTGFTTFYRPRVDLMSQSVIADNWVLGLSSHVNPTKEEQNTFKEQVRKKYTDDYISYWRNALSELKIRRYNSIGDLTNAIDLISGPSSPMTTVLKQVYNNTQFSPTSNDTTQLLQSKNSQLNKAVKAVKGEVQEVVQPDYVLMARVEQAFYSLNQLQISETQNSQSPWEETVAALNQVRSYIKDIADSPDVSMAALEVTRQKMESTAIDPLLKLKQIALKSPEPVRTWLLDLVSQTWSVMVREASKGIQEKWQSQVYSKFKEIGLGKYPFDLSAKKEISIEDFESLFAKGGILDTFIKTNLSPFYDTNLWTPKRVEGEILPLSPEFIVQMKNYNIIRDTLINKATNHLSIPFMLKVVDLDSSAIRASIKLADKRVDYYQGPSKAVELQWPPEGGEFVMSVSIQDVTTEGKQHVLSKDGQWAIYRMLGGSTLTNSHNGSFVSDIKVSGRGVSLRITPLTRRNPFTLPELYNFMLPESISSQ